MQLPQKTANAVKVERKREKGTEKERDRNGGREPERRVENWYPWYLGIHITLPSRTLVLHRKHWG